MTIKAQAAGTSDTLWLLYDPKDGGPGTDGGERGYIMRGEDGRYELHGRGDTTPHLGSFTTLDAAIAAAPDF